ncbi:hypothetical protein VYU27_008947, partial [Nannochloropsis oceanica]
MSEDTRNGKIGIAAATPGSATKRAGNGDENVFGTLFDLANATAAKLEALWEEVGCSAEDRKEHLQGLVVDFERLCQEKVREEESVRDQFHTSIAQLQQEVGELTARLGRSGGAPSPTRASLSGNGSTNLTDRLADLEETVEDLRVHKEERLQSLRATREKAEGLLSKMGEPLEPLFQDEKDLSEAKLAEVASRGLAVDKACEERQKVVVQLVLDCQGLMRELKWEATSTLEQQIVSSLHHGKLSSLAASPVCVGVHVDTVQRLSDKANELMAEKVRRADRLKYLGDQIAELWDRLK